MRSLGFKYAPRKKCYYVDGHERPDNVRYRRKFVHRYLFEYEPRTYRWIQLTEQQVDELAAKEQTFKKEDAFKIKNSDGTFSYEYHVDYSELFVDMVRHLPFGGHLSHRRPPNSKPLIIFGQDESIFRQFAMTKSCWYGPDGTTALVPKDDGQGVMISALISREFGYGLPLTKAELQRVNNYRKNRCYCNQESAKNKRGKIEKDALTESPFIRRLEYGSNKGGYWDYDHMVLQLEDCFDVMRTIHPEFDAVFLVDHSSGHDKMRPDGLNCKRIRKNFGGKQPKMRSSKIIDETYLGNYDKLLNVGDIQTMVYSENDEGPFYLSPQDRQRLKHDQISGSSRPHDILKEDLISMLKEKGMKDPKGSKKELQEQCNLLGLPTKKLNPVITEGWVDKAKGSFQVLYERGFIDITKVNDYTNEGSLVMGVRNTDLSLNSLIAKLPDFMEEETLLQITAKQLGYVVDRTPKCHPELAGEGIEYAWGSAKIFYRRQPMEEKKSKEKFRSLVDRSTCRETILSTQNIRRFSARARRYMIAYLAIDKVMQAGLIEGNSDEIPNQDEKLNMNVTYDTIEKCVKVFKCHRSALDFDTAFIKRIVDEMMKIK